MLLQQASRVKTTVNAKALAKITRLSLSLFRFLTPPTQERKSSHFFRVLLSLLTSETHQEREIRIESREKAGGED